MSGGMSMEDWLREVSDFPRKLTERANRGREELRDMVAEATAYNGDLSLRVDSDRNVQAINIDPDLYDQLEAEALAETIIETYGRAQVELGQQRRSINMGALGKG